MSMFKNLAAKSKSNLTNWTENEATLLKEMVDGILARKVSVSAMRDYVRHKDNRAEFDQNFPSRKPSTVALYLKNEIQKLRPSLKVESAGLPAMYDVDSKEKTSEEKTSEEKTSEEKVSASKDHYQLIDQKPDVEGVRRGGYSLGEKIPQPK